MPTIKHPNAVRDTDDDVDDAVTLGGETVDVGEDGTLEVSEAQADTLARRYDVSTDALRVGVETCEVVKSDGEVCGRELPCPYHSEDDE